jgi:hypothetical protein
VEIEVLLQFHFHLVHLGVNVGNHVVFKFLVPSGGHGEGKK